MHKNPYETMPEAYDAWFERNPLLFETELEAIRSLLPDFSKGLEIGAGSGLFMAALGLKEGIEPAAGMRARAKSIRGLDLIGGRAEACLVADDRYDLVLMVTVDCFLDDVPKAYKEVHRILQAGGSFLVAFLDGASPLGTGLQARKDLSPFYQRARLNTSQQIKAWLAQAGLVLMAVRQTVFSLENSRQAVCSGSGSGLFVVMRALKPLAEPEKARRDESNQSVGRKELLPHDPELPEY